MHAFAREGRIVYAGSGMPRYKRYLDEMPGVSPQDLWTDIPGALGKERTGFKTQKPLALLRRIIKTSSEPGDTVLDPFCGCATTMVAADALDRNWVGIDVSRKAVDLVVSRIKTQQGLHRRITQRTDVPQRTDLGPLPRSNSRENREALYGRQGGDCAGCGIHFEAKNLTVDHIIARSKGGTDHIENLQLLCGHCNAVKGDRGMEYLRAKLQLTAASPFVT